MSRIKQRLISECEASFQALGCPARAAKAKKKKKKVKYRPSECAALSWPSLVEIICWEAYDRVGVDCRFVEVVPDHCYSDEKKFHCWFDNAGYRY